MVNFCCAPGCSNRSNRDKHVSYHRFPKDQKLQKKWLKGIRRPNMTISNSTRVCSAHFIYGDGVPYVKSPSLVKKAESHRRALVRSRAERSLVPSLKQLSRQVAENAISTTTHLIDSIKTLEGEIAKKVSSCRELELELQTKRASIELCKAESASLLSKQEVTQANLELLQAKMSILTVENESLLKKVQFFEESRYRLRAENLKGKDSDVQFYTGFTSWELFMLFFESLKVYDLDNLQYIGRERTFPNGKKRGPPRALDPLNEFFLTLVRLRVGLLEKDLADRFNISQSLVSVIFNTWLNLLYQHLTSLLFWPSREMIQKNLPKEFSKCERYKKTRIILDATELFVEKPSDLSIQSVTWSSYKSHNTLKGLIGICPFGGITFVSDLWAGSVSDVELTKKSGLLFLLERGDYVMADKGFKIEEMLAEVGVSLCIPPFMSGGKLSADEVALTREIAALRIHVERAIERVKNYRILHGVIPNSIPASTVNKIFYVCSMLTNMNRYLVKPQASNSSGQACSTALADITNVTESLLTLTKEDIEKKLTISPEIQKIIEVNTKEQRKCELWHKLRNGRLTSSNFGLVVKRKKNFESLAIQLSQKKNFVHTNVPSLKWGIENEDRARSLYEQELLNTSPSLKVVPSGLWIDTSMGWLAASPDGLIYDGDQLIGLLEIKCPFSAKDLSPLEAANTLPAFFCSATANQLLLKRNSDYYYQVQGQLAIVKQAIWCDFVVYTPQGISVERLRFDASFWEATVGTLNDFYFTYMLSTLRDVPTTIEVIDP